MIERTSRNKKRAIIVAIAAACALLCATLLAGCIESKASSSAKQISFNAAFSENYQAALEEARSQADDVKFIAVRTSSYGFAGSSPSWMYLFYSWKDATAYTVFVVDGVATAGETGALSFTQGDLDAVPDISGITYDANAAYELLTESLEGDGELLTCRSYLMAYAEGEEDPTADAMKWFFSFNEEADIEDLAAESAAESDENSEADRSPRAFTVDAMTGEIEELSQEADEQSDGSTENQDEETATEAGGESMEG